jgi:hypothetical protein
VLDLTTKNFTHFDNVVQVDNSKDRMLRLPEELVFVGATSSSPRVAPWIKV